MPLLYETAKHLASDQTHHTDVEVDARATFGINIKKTSSSTPKRDFTNNSLQPLRKQPRNP